MQSGSHVRDWKVSRLHRLLVVTGWAIAILGLYFAVLAVIFGFLELWGTAAALSAVAVGLGVVLPEPVPRDMLIGGRTRLVVEDW